MLRDHLDQEGATVWLNGPRNWQNPVFASDINNDGNLRVTPTGDILPLINEINSRTLVDQSGQLPSAPSAPITFYYDVNGDGLLTPAGDILFQINLANDQIAAEGETPRVHTLVAPPWNLVVQKATASSTPRPAIRPTDPSSPDLAHHPPVVTANSASATAHNAMLAEEQIDELLLHDEWLEALTATASLPPWRE